MNKKYTRVLCIFILAIVTLSLFAPARKSLGDFGGFSGGSDYDRGGGSSGGSSWSSSSSYDSDGSGIGGALAGYLIGAIFGGDTDDEDMDFLADIVVVIFVGFILYKAFQSSKKGKGVRMPRVTQRANLRPMSEYQTLDPNFDEAMFNAWVAKVYVQLQDAWHEKDLEPVRPYLSDAIFNQMDGGLDTLRKRHYTNYIENIAVLGVDLQGFTQKGGLDCIIARVTTRITDYTLDDATGKLVSGDKRREKFMEYEWELVRKSGVVTSKTQGVKATTCPHCGAPLDKSASMKCPFCGSVLTAASEEWVISNMQGISQRTK